MTYARYLLSKTGLFPKMVPGVDDVLSAADLVGEVKDVITNHGHCYYYVIPERNNINYLVRLSRVFRSNGIILRPHHSRHYGRLVFRVKNNNQKFMRDVIAVKTDRNKFQDVLGEYNKTRRKFYFKNIIKEK